MGGANSKPAQQNVVDITNHLVSESIVSATSQCQQNIRASQVVDMECNPSPEMEQLVAKRCESIASSHPSLLASNPELCYACVQKDIEQDSYVTFNASCEMDQDISNKIANEVQNQAMQAAENKDDAAGKVFNNLLGGGKEAGQANFTTFVNDVRNVFTVNVMQQMMTDLGALQQVTFKGSGGIQAGISQKSAVEMVTSTITKNKAYNEAVGKFASKVEQTSKTENVGLFAVLNNLIGTVGDVFGGAIWGTVIVLGGIILAVIALGYFASKLLSSPEGAKLAGEAMKQVSQGKGRRR